MRIYSRISASRRSPALRGGAQRFAAEPMGDNVGACAENGDNVGACAEIPDRRFAAEPMGPHSGLYRETLHADADEKYF